MGSNGHLLLQDVLVVHLDDVLLQTLDLLSPLRIQVHLHLVQHAQELDGVVEVAVRVGLRYRDVHRLLTSATVL